MRSVEVARCAAADIGVSVLPDDPVARNVEEDDAMAVIVVDGNESVRLGQ